MERVYRLIVDRPIAVLLSLLVLTAFFGVYAREIQIDSSVDALLPQDDPEKRYYEDVRRLFGSDEVGVVGVMAEDVYAPETLRKIKRLTQAIERIDGVEKVVSLTNAMDPIADAVEPPLLIPAIPASAEESRALRVKLADRPIFQKNLVSLDGRAAALNVFFRNMSDDEFMRRGIDEAVEAVVEKEQGPEAIYYSGLPHFKVYSARAMWRDLARFVPITLGIVIVVLFLSFRSIRGVLLPAATVILSLVWTLGIMVLAGSRLSLGSTSLPPLLLVIGTAYSLHVVSEYYELARAGRSPREVVRETLGRIGAPVLIAAVTTVLGFLSIGLNDIPSIRDMGIYSGIGITLAFVLSLVLVPALLVLLPLPSRDHAEPFSPALAGALRRVAEIAMRRRGAAITVGALISLASIVPIPQIRVDSNFQSFFRENDPIRRATDAINRNLVGTGAFYVAIDGAERDIVKKWDTLRRIKDLQLFIDSLPGVDKTVSFVDYCEAFDRGAQEVGGRDILIGPGGEILEEAPAKEKTTFWKNPEQLGAVIQLVSSNPKNFSSVVNPEFSRTNILVRTSLTRSSDISAAVEKIQAYAEGRFPPELRVHPTGNLLLLTHTTGNIVAGQIQSLALTAGTIFVIMSAMFLSVRVGIIAMVPNVFPILVFLGLMGFTGADLNLATNMIASIALGIAVDDTIHIMSRLSSEVRTTADQERALLDTITAVGKPALYASLLLFLGFLTLCFSSFVPIQEFGFLSAATMAFGVAGELLLTPAFLSTTRIITLWDLLYLKLGKDPHKTIGIFEHLRPWQAKIVALMGELRSFPSGQPIVREGEVGDTMYVIIDGRAEVRVDSGGQSRRVRELGRGDVFGEMGLIRRDRRSADVIAASEVEVMAMDRRFLDRVQRRYPRIASKIFLNIAKVLSDRLQEETRR